VIGRAAEQRQEHLVGAKPDPHVQAEIAIVRHQHVGPAPERHRRGSLHRFVAFAGRGKRNLSLTVELEAPVFEGAVRQHGAKHRDELLVGQAMPLEGRIDFGSHGLRYSPGPRVKSSTPEGRPAGRPNRARMFRTLVAVAGCAIALWLAAAGRAQALTEFCPATLVATSPYGASSTLTYALRAATPRTIVKASLIADTDRGWFRWDVSGVPLIAATDETQRHHQEEHVARSDELDVTFPASVFVRHAWVVRAKTAGEKNLGWDAQGDVACEVPAFDDRGGAAPPGPSTPSVRQSAMPPARAYAVEQPFRIDCAQPFVAARVTHSVEPSYPGAAPKNVGENEVTVEVAVDERNELVDAWIYEASGYAALDNSALAGARASSYAAPVSYCQTVGGFYFFRAVFRSL
jgi:TonB family protein